MCVTRSSAIEVLSKAKKARAEHSIDVRQARLSQYWLTRFDRLRANFAPEPLTRIITEGCTSSNLRAWKLFTTKYPGDNDHVLLNAYLIYMDRCALVIPLTHLRAAILDEVTSHLLSLIIEQNVRLGIYTACKRIIRNKDLYVDPTIEATRVNALINALVNELNNSLGQAK